MKTLGSMMGEILSRSILVIGTALFTASLTSLMVKDMLVENISGHSESLEVKTEGFEVKVTGKNTMAAVMNLLQTERSSEILPLVDRF